jgi:lysozyme
LRPRAYRAAIISMERGGMAQQTSSKGIAFLQAHEGVVLKAYRCPAGIWTIGSGLTAASGVVKPKAGMVITAREAARLLQAALARSYEPRVRQALGNCSQHAFDGGVSFDFNTGAIHKASWVPAFLARNMTKARTALSAWNKGGGKVLPGLVRRRAEEADVIILDKWPKNLNFAVVLPLGPEDQFARFVVSVTQVEIAAIRDGFRAVGFDPGKTAGYVLRSAAEAFQRKYGLTVDGKIGRATLSTLQRELDARTRTKASAYAAGGGGALASGNETINPAASDLPVGDHLVTLLGFAAMAGAALYGLWLAYQYRDMIAARIAGPLPRVAAFLRSF